MTDKKEISFFISIAVQFLSDLQKKLLLRIAIFAKIPEWDYQWPQTEQGSPLDVI